MKGLFTVLILGIILLASCTKKVVEVEQTVYINSWESQTPGYEYTLEAQLSRNHFAQLTADSTPVEVTHNIDGTFTYEVTFNIARLDTNPNALQILQFTVWDAVKKYYRDVPYTLKNINSDGTTTGKCKFTNVTYLPSEQFVDNIATSRCTFFYSF